jgi:molecular chaperone DnaK
MVHATRSSLKEMGDKIGDDDKASIETAIEGVEEAMKGDDKEAIEGAVNKLTEAAQVIYQQAAAQAESSEPQPGQPGEEAQAQSGDDVVDAEFEEVDDDNKKD